MNWSAKNPKSLEVQTATAGLKEVVHSPSEKVKIVFKITFHISMYRHWPIYKYLHEPKQPLINTVAFFLAATTTFSYGKKILKKLALQTLNFL